MKTSEFPYNTSSDIDPITSGIIANFDGAAGQIPFGQLIKALDANRCFVDTGDDDAYVITTGQSLTSIAAKTVFFLQVTTGNTGACTVAVDSVAAKAIKVIDASGKRDPFTGELPAGGIGILYFDGTDFILLNPVKTKKEYKAYISQIGTSDPTVVVIQNTFANTIVWTRSSVGIYVGTLTNAFTTEKTFVNGNTPNQSVFSFIYDSDEDADFYIEKSILSVNQVVIKTLDNTKTAADGILNGLFFSVEVYP